MRTILVLFVLFFSFSAFSEKLYCNVEVHGFDREKWKDYSDNVFIINFDNNTLNTEHYINHIAFNPSGNRFLFFHVWNNNGKRRTRAITSDVHGNN